MKKIRVWTMIGVVFVFSGLSLRAQQHEPGTAGPNASAMAPAINVNAVAILRWYPANLTTTFGFGTLSFPSTAAFDGANIWVSNPGTSSVTKFRANDGAILGTFSVPAGADFLAFDGANSWVTTGSIINSTVTKLQATDGTVLGTFPVGAQPIGAAFDGANVWVVNLAGGTVSKL